MREEVAVFFGIAVAVVITITAVAFASRRTKEIRQILAGLATSAGWSGLRNAFLAAAGVKGTWRSFPVELSYHQRQKGTPERLVLKVRARTDGRLIVKRKFEGFFSNRPLTWFGPPVIDLHQPAAAELWVRSDQPALAERLLGDSDLARRLVENLLARFDEVKIDRRGLKIARALDERPVRVKYGIGAFSMKFDPSRYESIAREELALAEALVERLAAMP